MHSLTDVATMISSFERCQYFPKETSCRCFYASDLRQVSYIFRGTENCRVVQFDLKNMVYGISGVYGAGLAVCLIAGVLECLLLSPSRRSKVSHSSFAHDVIAAILEKIDKRFFDEFFCLIFHNGGRASCFFASLGMNDSKARIVMYSFSLQKLFFLRVM